MLAKITKTLIAEINPQKKPYEINDTELKGFLVRVSKIGTITFIVSYRWKGKRNRVTIGQHPVLSPIQARAEAKKILASKALGTDPGVAKVAKKSSPVIIHTLGSFIESEYKAWYEASRKDGSATIRRIRSAFSDLLVLPLSEINTLAIDRWKTGRLTLGRTPVTINRDLDSLKSLFSTALDWGFIAANELAGYKRLKVDASPKVRFLDAAEENRLINAMIERDAEMKAARDRANQWREERGYTLFPSIADPILPMVIVSLNTGIRWGTLVRLIWEDIDLKNAILTIRAGIEKSNKTRFIPLNSKVVETLKTWKEAINYQGHEIVFPGKTGEAKTTAKKAWAGIKERANIKKFRWHDLRHTFASKLVMRGIDLNTVRDLLGHADIKMTLRYAHLAPEHKAAAVAVLLQ